MGIFSMLYRKNFVHRYDDDHIIYYFAYTDFPGMMEKPVEFKTPQGLTIKGHIYSYPGEHKKDLVVFCHGLGGGHRSYMREIECICKQGYEVLSYDIIGCWESEGKDVRGMSEAINDLVACLDFIYQSKELKDRGLHIIGHSWGGYAAGNILSYRQRNIRTITVISGFAGLESFAEVAYGGKLKPFKKNILNFEKKVNPEYALSCSVDALKNTQIKVLLIQSKDDSMVPISSGLEYVRSRVNNENISYVVVEGKYHNPNYTEDAVQYMGQTFGEFNQLVKEKKLKTLEQKQAFMKEKDFMRMTEQDGDVWKKIFEMMSSEE